MGSLEIALGAHATDAVPQGQGNVASASGKHDLISRTISGLELSGVLFAGEQTYIIWKPTLHIPRPRARLQRPAVYFTASLNLTSSALNGTKNDRGDFLKSFEPLPGNVLEPLQFDSALGGSTVHLPEDMITKVMPTSATVRNELKPIRRATKRAFPIGPALYTRIRYFTLPDAVIASLHLEASHLVYGSVTVDDVFLDVNGTAARHLTSSTDSQGLLAGDETVRLYKLVPQSQVSPTTPYPLSVRIRATVKIDRGSSVGLEVSWQTHVDLTKAALKPNYKWSRPLSGSQLQPPSRPSMHAGSRPSSSDLERKSKTAETGMLFSFTMRTMVRKSEEFGLEVHCHNRSGRTRRFALVVLHLIRHHTDKAEKVSSLENTDLIASIFNAPPLARTTAPDVLDLNPDVRIGPLPAGAVFETQMKFRAVASGPLDLGVIRIVDLDTRQTVDVREMPDVIALTLGEEVPRQVR